MSDQDRTGSIVCPVCGRTDGRHDMSRKEKRALRRLGRRAFWLGFTHPFSSPFEVDDSLRRLIDRFGSEAGHGQ